MTHTCVTSLLISRYLEELVEESAPSVFERLDGIGNPVKPALERGGGRVVDDSKMSNKQLQRSKATKYSLK